MPLASDSIPDLKTPLLKTPMACELPKNIIDFCTNNVVPVEKVTRDPALVDTPYRSLSWRYLVDPTQNVTAGIWEAEPHLERCLCDYSELCHILDGTVRLTDSEGVARTFGPGDSFVVSAGFQGTWENITNVRKVFVLIGT
jgi:uncharacterized cupin superfamily protein